MYNSRQCVIQFSFKLCNLGLSVARALLSAAQVPCYLVGSGLIHPTLLPLRARWHPASLANLGARSGFQEIL